MAFVYLKARLTVGTGSNYNGRCNCSVQVLDGDWELVASDNQGLYSGNSNSNSYPNGCDRTLTRVIAVQKEISGLRFVLDLKGDSGDDDNQCGYLYEMVYGDLASEATVQTNALYDLDFAPKLTGISADSDATAGGEGGEISFDFSDDGGATFGAAVDQPNHSALYTGSFDSHGAVRFRLKSEDNLSPCMRGYGIQLTPP